jgi:hypothetical protein
VIGRAGTSRIRFGRRILEIQKTFPCGCAVGTIKSRVNRARSRLAAILSIESADHFGPDHETRAVMGQATGAWRRL